MILISWQINSYHTQMPNIPNISTSAVNCSIFLATQSALFPNSFLVSFDDQIRYFPWQKQSDNSIGKFESQNDNRVSDATNHSNHSAESALTLGSTSKMNIKQTLIVSESDTYKTLIPRVRTVLHRLQILNVVQQPVLYEPKACPNSWPIKVPRMATFQILGSSGSNCRVEDRMYAPIFRQLLLNWAFIQTVLFLVSHPQKSWTGSSFVSRILTPLDQLIALRSLACRDMHREAKPTFENKQIES